MAKDPDLFKGDDEALGGHADDGFETEEVRFGAAEAGSRIGRPKGALNRKTKDFERYYQAQGFKDPLVAMGQYLTADPLELYMWFIENEPNPKRRPGLMEIIHEQHSVAAALAPYLHGKKPVEVAIVDERLPTLIIDLGTNQLEEGRKIAGQKALSAGQPIEEAEANEINALAEDE